ncbi:NAD(P)/FAD-dependent oxidoreductase [Tropheryma whipplei]|uniref:Putative thioredoxin reductase n=1 Tax=Tropheryma whipplei (strain Twist) TaxID=203267 RepID=Q83N12_TROWT|nr:NAD(P)/FAD-dependent oxidoreductase [Tropheryma whipplei]AAO44307.1 putative thioredoxin reductase [Tropheryma whipplei str. Twist]
MCVGVIDVAIIGGGPAGLTAGISLARMGWKVCVFDSNRPRNAATIAVHGVIAREGISPHALRSDGGKALISFGGKILPSEVVSVVWTGDQSSVGLSPISLSIDGSVAEPESCCAASAISDMKSNSSSEGAGTEGAGTRKENQWYEVDALLHPARNREKFLAKTVLISSGVREVFPQIKNLRAVYGTNIHSCLSCDMWEKRFDSVGLIGYGPDAVDILQRAIYLSFRVSSIVVFYNQFNQAQKGILENLGVKIVETQLTEVLLEEGAFTGFMDAAGKSHTVSSAFLRPIWKPNVDFIKNPSLNSQGFIITGNDGRLNRGNMWAAGDVTGIGQVSIAAGQGASVALDIGRYLFTLHGNKTHGNDALGHISSRSLI